MSSFKTYIDITEHGSEDYEWVINDDDSPRLEPRLLPGEVVVASASNVLKFASVSNRKHGISGCLFVTNFKIVFASPTSSSYSNSSKDERNKLLSPNEVCLANVDQVYQLSGDRRKRLTPGTNIVANVKVIQVVCKDFSVHSFSFKFCPVGSHKPLINAILHHSFPKRVELLFTFECSLPQTQPIDGMQYFSYSEDWENEIERCQSSEGWRVCIANETFSLSASLPKGFVIPRSLSDNQILKASKHFVGNRPPVWCWGHVNKCVIVRMAVLHPFTSDTQQESIMLEHVRKSHPNLKEPLILELDKSMPQLADIQASWCKMRDACCIPLDNIRKFWEQDDRCLSLLSHSRWAHHVMLCLRMANRVVEAISRHQVSVVLQEGESRDMSGLISSLAQLIMDPHFRTINGFQTLIQKEWIALGHPFTKRLGRLSELEGKQAPLFQLFLDCVWQMQNQLPTAFEFSDTYLTSVWDSLHNSIFDTFVFDSVRMRQLMTQPTRQQDADSPTLVPRSVWDWSVQFHDIDIGLFYNPLFAITSRVGSDRKQKGIPPTALLVPPGPQQSMRRTQSGGLSDRPRRNSISGSLTLPRTEYGAAEPTSGSDTLGRSWGSRLGLTTLSGENSSNTRMRTTTDGAASNDANRENYRSRWKRFRGTLFYGHGRSFSPRTHEITSIAEGLELPTYAEEGAVVTYRALRGLNDPGQPSQRWTIYGGGQATVYDPIPSYTITMKPSSKPIKLELNWKMGGIPYHELEWPVYTTLPVADAVMDFQLWRQCYLRWIPVLDIRGGGQPPVYFHYCSLVNDILSLEAQINRLQLGDVDKTPDESNVQRFVTLSDQSQVHQGIQVTLSSFHPFVQHTNDSALSFGEWEIVPSPLPNMTFSGGQISENENDGDGESFVAE